MRVLGIFYDLGPGIFLVPTILYVEKTWGVLGTLRLPKNYLKIFLFQTTKILFFLILIFNHKQDLVLKCSAWVSLWIKV